jgi:hypothetical protein
MLSVEFKRTLKEKLFSEYNLNCYKILDQTKPTSGYITKIYKLHCTYNDYKVDIYLHLYNYYSNKIYDKVYDFKILMSNTDYSQERILSSSLYTSTFNDSLKTISAIFEKHFGKIEFNNYFLDSFSLGSGSYVINGNKTNIVNINMELFVKKVFTFCEKKQMRVFSKFCLCTFQDGKVILSIINKDIETDIKIENGKLDQELLTLTFWRMLLIDLSFKCSNDITNENIMEYDVSYLEKITTILGMINI